MEADDLRSQEPASNEASERLIADRLDALEAERVIHRALELEAESLQQPLTLDASRLERVAQEIGMDAAFVRQALSEVRLTGAPRSRLDELILPHELVEMTTLSGLDRQQAHDAVVTWMTEHEGLRPAGGVVDGATEWDIDRQFKRRVQSAVNLGGNRISRVAGSDIQHQMHTAGEQEHVVALRSKGTGPLMLAKALGLGGLATFLFIAVESLTSSLGDALRSLLSGAVLSGGIVAAGVFGARYWAERIRRSFRGSLAGLQKNAKPGRKRNWFPKRRKGRS